MSEKKILVVDDEKAIINLLTQAFSRAGFTVRSAQNAKETLELLQNALYHISLRERYV